jgi:hypothetical protein
MNSFYRYVYVLSIGPKTPRSLFFIRVGIEWSSFFPFLFLAWCKTLTVNAFLLSIDKSYRDKNK